MPRKDDYFTDDLIRRTAQEFAVSYINQGIQVNVARRRKSDGGTQTSTFSPETFQKLKESEILSYETRFYGTGTIYQYEHVVLRDEAFADLDKLVDIVARRIDAESEREDAMKKLYSMAMLLKKQDRIEGDFALKPFRDAEIDRLEKRIDNLTERVNKIPLAGRGAIQP